MSSEYDRSNGTDECVGGRVCDPDWLYEYEYCGLADCLDLICCCDVCIHHMLASCDAPDGGFCCKCAPKAIVAQFTPDNETDHCRVFTTFLEAQVFAFEPVIYSAGLPGLRGRTRILLGRTSDYEAYEYGPCEWRIQADEYYEGVWAIDESFEITHKPGASCRDLPTGFPAFDVTHKAASACNPACTGTLAFSVYVPEKVPFRKNGPTVASVPLTPSRGPCSSTCSLICVIRQAAGEFDRTRHVFHWDAGSQSWKGGRAVYEYCEEEEIDLVEDEYGNCFFRIKQWDESTGDFLGDLIALPAGDCEKFSVEAEDLDGNYLKITCSNCGCWDHVCGRCRCVCGDLCVVGANEDNLLIRPSGLAWDDLASGWVGGEYGDESVTLTNVEGADCLFDKCAVSVAGFADPIVLFDGGHEDICQNGFSFTILEENEYGFKWRSFWCSRGAACDGEGSCVQCEDVPKTVYADVSAVEWDISILGCPGMNSGETACLQPFQIPMQIVRDLNQDAAADTFWYGAASFTCRGCFGSVKTYVMLLNLSCDGNFRMRLVDLATGEIVYDETKTVTPPCSDCDYPFDETLIFDGMEDALVTCCDGDGGIQIDLSE